MDMTDFILHSTQMKIAMLILVCIGGVLVLTSPTMMEYFSDDKPNCIKKVSVLVNGVVLTRDNPNYDKELCN
jgi:hypothetical protein